jgi:hypothetical protein
MCLKRFIISISLTILSIGCADDSSTTLGKNLEEGFLSPPREAHPNVMWWWLNSNISKEGITRDLEEMKRQGIGGALIFDAAPVDRWRPKNVEAAPVGPPFMSEQWRELFRYAIKEADRLDLELGVSMTSGFNAGGPWVTPEYGQQELVWSTTPIEGPKDSPIKLSLPSGPIYGNDGQLLSYNEMQVNNELEYDQYGNPVHYRDVTVLAVPVPQSSNIPIPQDSIESTTGRLKNWALKSVRSFDYPEDKGFVFDVVYDNIDNIPAERVLPSNSVIDLTSYLDAKGYLNWFAPPGKWLILRFGHTHTGIRLQATNPQNKGLAMNHLSAEAARRHFDEIGKKMVEDIDTINGKSLRYFYLDSWEVRIANWTAGFRQEFINRRGYDMTPYLPVLAGYIVDNREISNRFLHDYRQTIGDCIADNYYGQFQNLSHQNGLAYHAEMATTPIPVDMLKCLGRTDIPFGEFWTETDLGTGRVEPWERMFGKQAASAAHIYGKRFVAAEALTVIQKHWEHSPFQLKKTVDQAFCSGLNKLMIHTFTHSSPDVRPPGYEYFAGTHFNPQITWWKQAHAFTGYIGRSQYLLQQGHFVADVCFYQGDQIPSFVTKKHVKPELGYGYDYDVVNSEVILDRMSVEDGKFVLPDGMQYRLLVLPDTDRINPQVLSKLDTLIQAGGIVIGPKPKSAYGLFNYPGNDSVVLETAERIWGRCDGKDVKENRYGEGTIVWGKTLREVLLEGGIFPDFEYRSNHTDSDIDFIHRTLHEQSEKIEIYFLANFKDRWENIKTHFRVTNRVPEIWDPLSGQVIDIGLYEDIQGRTTCSLTLPPHGSLFVVFRKAPNEEHQIKIVEDKEGLYSGLLDPTMSDAESHILENPWTLKFPPGWGAPDSITIAKLKSWNEFSDPGIKYFSGTAEYETTFYLSDSLIKKMTIYYLDLGNVKNVADIEVNDKKYPLQWTKPYRINITSNIVAGTNKLRVSVTNLWPNRLIGDQFLPIEERFAFTNIGKFTKESPLLESGLIGPVKIIIERR